MAVKIQFRRDTATNWSNENPILSQGEMALDITNNRFKLGDGSTAWNSLPYAVDFQPDGTYPDLRAQATTAEDVGLENVANESKSTMFTNPTFTGTVSGVTATMVDLGNVTNESKATMFTDPTFTGTVTGVTKGMVGLTNVLDVAQIPATEKGQADGVVPLNGSTKIDSTYLPSFVDDVLEFASSAQFPAEGETGKIYVAIDTNKTHRWTGTQYVEISASLVPNNGTLTVQGTTGLSGTGTFTADQSSNATITITPVVASESEAQVGTESQKLMTPQRTKQAINANFAAGVIEENNSVNLKFWSGTQAQYDALAPVTLINADEFMDGQTNTFNISPFTINDVASFTYKVDPNQSEIIYSNGVYSSGFGPDPNAPAGTFSITGVNSQGREITFYTTDAGGNSVNFVVPVLSDGDFGMTVIGGGYYDSILYFVTEV